MLAVFVNALAIVAGSGLGLLIKRLLSTRVSDTVLIGVGACFLYIGITSITARTDTVVMLLAFGIGAFMGSALDLDDKMNRMGRFLERKLTGGREDAGLANGCITFFIVSCGGAYPILASFNAGLGDNAMLYSKAVMDFIVSMTMSAAMGIGVMFSAVLTFVYHAVLILFAGLLSPIFTETMLTAFSDAGALITLLIGTNMIGATNLKTMNFLPAIIVAPIIAQIAAMLGM